MVGFGFRNRRFTQRYLRYLKSNFNNREQQLLLKISCRDIWYIYISIWMFPKIVVPPNHPLKNRLFHYFHHPFWGKIHYFWKHPYSVSKTPFKWKFASSELAPESCFSKHIFGESQGVINACTLWRDYDKPNTTTIGIAFCRNKGSQPAMHSSIVFFESFCWFFSISMVLQKPLPTAIKHDQSVSGRHSCSGGG